MDVEYMRLEDVKPYDSNPRNNADGVEAVANSIRDFGFRSPIIVDKENVIIAGHTRYLAAKSLGLESVPVIVASDLTDEQVKAFRIADNKTAEKSGWNLLKLSKEIIGIDFDFTDYGFGDIEIDNLTSLGNDFFGTHTADDYVPEASSFAPNVYTPNVTPQESKSIVNDQQVERAKERLETRFTSRMVNTHKKVTCPYCGEEFEID